MDWISRLEEEDKRKTAAAIEANVRYSKANQERFTRFQSLLQRVQPFLEERRAQITKRLRIPLSLTAGSSELILEIFRPSTGMHDAAYSFSFKLSDYDGHSVRVIVEEQWIENREGEGEKPDEMSSEEWFGYKREIVNVRAPMDELLESDLDVLLEWVVNSDRAGRSIGPPRNFRAYERQQHDRKAREKRINNWAFTAFGACVLGLATFFFPVLMAGPLVLLLGILARIKLKRLKQSEGLGAAALAIGLGVFETFILALWIVRSLR